MHKPGVKDRSMLEIAGKPREKIELRPKNRDAASPIGIFDSGVGGLSVVREARKLLPNENIIYYSDSKYAPYGVKDVDFVRKRVDYIAALLFDLGIKALVVACNTATSLSCHLLREQYDIPVIGMEPALKVAVDEGKKKIAVLATNTTLREQKFEKLMNRMALSSVIYKFPAPSLVAEIEGKSYTKESIYAALDEAFTGRDKNEMDAVVLGCTHFVLVRDHVQDYFRPLPLFDGNYGTIQNLKRILNEKGLLNEKQVEMETETLEGLPGVVRLKGLSLLDSNPDNTRSLLHYVD